VGRRGTALAWWVEGHDPHRNIAFASGPAGDTPTRRNVVLRMGEPNVTYDFFRAELGNGDRPQFTWLTLDYTSLDSPTRHRIWSARGGPHGGRTGRPKVTYSLVGETNNALRDAVYHLLTDGRGGQVMPWWRKAPPVYVTLCERKPGARFRSRFVPGRSFYVTSQAINPAGDAIYAGESGNDVYALYRARDGAVTGTVNLTPERIPFSSGRPVAAIDDAGHAVVVWQSSRHHPVSSAGYPQEIMAATTDRRGRFSRPRVISGSGSHEDIYPHVAVSPGGRAIVSWSRIFPRGDDNWAERMFVARGRLDR